MKKIHKGLGRDSKHNEYAVLYKRRCRAQIKSVVSHPTQELTNLYLISCRVQFVSISSCQIHELSSAISV